MTRNDWLIVNQFTVKGSKTVRPDMVAFVNGLPLAVIDAPQDADFAIYEMGAGKPGDIDMAGVADSAIARFDELTMPDDDDEVEANRERNGGMEPGDGVPVLRRRCGARGAGR